MSMTSASRGVSLISFAIASGVIGSAASPTIFLHSLWKSRSLNASNAKISGASGSRGDDYFAVVLIKGRLGWSGNRQNRHVCKYRIKNIRSPNFVAFAVSFPSTSPRKEKDATIKRQCVSAFDPKATMRFFRPKRDICAGKFAVLHVVSHGTRLLSARPMNSRASLTTKNLVSLASYIRRKASCL